MCEIRSFMVIYRQSNELMRAFKLWQNASHDNGDARRRHECTCYLRGLMTDPSETNPRDRSLIKRLVRKLIDIVKQKDTPHRIALGAALGIFIGILPIMGIQMTVVAIIAIPLRANLKAAVAGVWISNPITFLPMYWGYYKFGLLFFPQRAMSLHEFRQIIHVAGDWDWSAIGASISRIMAMGADILIPMWAGATILAVAFGIPTYFVTKQFVIAYRARKRRKATGSRAAGA